MKKMVFFCLSLLLLIPLSPAKDHHDNEGDEGQFRAKLAGFQEVPPILTGASGTFKATLDSAGTTLSYTLTFSNLSSTTVASHIHFGQRGVSGGVMAFLCGGGNKPACPVSGTITGTIMAADIVGPTDQGVQVGDFAGFLRIIRSGNAYANVHSTNFRTGEIRGQISFDD